MRRTKKIVSIIKLSENSTLARSLKRNKKKTRLSLPTRIKVSFISKVMD
jgi:hypothetical protein